MNKHIPGPYGGEKPDIESIKLADLILDKTLQPRAGIDDETVAEYQDVMQRGAKDFPPIYVVETPEGLCLVDGWHRVEAAKRNGYAGLMARVWVGDRADAIEFAAQCNARHGKPRTTADLVKIIAMLRSAPRWASATDESIGRCIGASRDAIQRALRYLREQRQQLCGPHTLPQPIENVESRDQPPQIRERKDGKPYDASRVGAAQQRRRQQRAKAPEAPPEPAGKTPAERRAETIAARGPQMTPALREAWTLASHKQRLDAFAAMWRAFVPDDKLAFLNQYGLPWLAEHEKGDAADPRDTEEPAAFFDDVDSDRFTA
jgi:hypothetical protein